MASVRVADDAVDRLLHHAEQRHLEVLGKALAGLVDLDAGRDAGFLEVSLGVPADRGCQAKVVERHRAQVQDEAPRLFQETGGDRSRLLKPFSRLGLSLIEVVAGAVQGDRQCRKRLGSLIVEFPGQSGALVLLGGDNLRQQLTQASRALPAPCSSRVLFVSSSSLVGVPELLAHALQALGQLAYLILSSHADGAFEVTLGDALCHGGELLRRLHHSPWS